VNLDTSNSPDSPFTDRFDKIENVFILKIAASY